MNFNNILQAIENNSNIIIEDVLLESKNNDYKPITLPYELNSLEPYIDKKTMGLHYNKHYKGYIKKLNELTKLRTPLDKLITNIGSKNDKIRFNAGGAYNHQLYWQMMTPDTKPIFGDIKEAIEKKYGSYKDFTEAFLEKATTIMGSGWCWLVLKAGKLDLVTTPNQDNPLMDNLGTPVLGIDMWEHAFYLKHGPEKKDYVKDFLKVIDWHYCNSVLALK